jgi:hypothetical protein
MREQWLVAGSVGKNPAQPREIDTQDRVDRLRRRTVPELLDEPVPRNALVRVQDEKAEERALLRAAEREDVLAPDDLERPEDAKLEIRAPLRRPMVRRSLGP